MPGRLKCGFALPCQKRHPCLVPELSLPKFPQPANERFETTSCTETLLLFSLSSRANSAKKPCAALVDANEGEKGRKGEKDTAAQATMNVPTCKKKIDANDTFEMRRFQLAWWGPAPERPLASRSLVSLGGQRASAREDKEPPHARLWQAARAFSSIHTSTTSDHQGSRRRANEPPSEAQSGKQQAQRVGLALLISTSCRHLAIVLQSGLPATALMSG